MGFAFKRKTAHHGDLITQEACGCLFHVTGGSLGPRLLVELKLTDPEALFL